MRRVTTLVVVGIVGSAQAGPVVIDSWQVSGEWGVFADDGVGGLGLPDQGLFHLSPGSNTETWEQLDGISFAQSHIGGDLVVDADSNGATFAGGLDLSVHASVTGNGPGDDELAIATVGLTGVTFNVSVADPVLLTIEGRPVTEVFQGLGVLDEGEYELLPGAYWFDVAGPGLFLDAFAGAGETDLDTADFDWSMQFAVVPSMPVLGIFGVFGVMSVASRRR